METEPGKSARRMACRERRWAEVLLLCFLILDGLVLAFGFHARRVANSGLLALTFAQALRVISEKLNVRVAHRFNKARWAELGAEGEEEVGRILAGQAPDDFYTVSDLAFPFGNIDHVVICRSGAVFVVEAKASKGRIDRRGETLLINDCPFDRDPIDQATWEALWVTDVIGHVLGVKPYVSAVGLFTSAFVNVRGPVRGVQITNLGYMKRGLTARPASSSERETLWNNKELVVAAPRGEPARSNRVAA